MKLSVPFSLQTTPLNCGPVALQMILSYFGDKTDLKIIEEKTGIEEGRGISTIQIAIASASLGYKTHYFSKHIGFNPEHLKHEFYKKYSNLSKERSERFNREAQNAGVKINEKVVSLNELLNLLTKDSIPIVLLDWNIVKNQKEKGYQGHFVPIVGYDSKNVIVHNHGLNNPKEFLAIERSLFDSARKAEGTDEDFLVISRK